MLSSKPLKLLLIGDSNVGKTSLLLRYLDNTFSDKYITTIGVEFKSKDITLNNKTYKIHIWDTAGQERYKSITRNFYKHAEGIIFVYDITNKTSFSNLKNWISNAENEADFKIIIVGNKLDMESRREVSIEQLKKLAKKKNCKYFETSAKDNINVENLFLSIINEMINNIKDEVSISESVINLSNEKSINQNNKYCC
jgi:small GTP-binding protein